MIAVGSNLGDRQRGFMDTTLLSGMRVGVVGVSRAMPAIEIVTSSGVGDWVLCDPQTVSGDNIGPTAFQWDEVGLAKVEAAKARQIGLNPNARVETHQCKAEEINGLPELVQTLDVLKIGVDDPAAQFCLADLAQEVGTTAVVSGTTGDNSQYFAAVVTPNGPPLRALLPHAWAGIQAGYQPPEFFRSCRLNAETASLLAARVVLAVLHHQGGSTLSIGKLGAAMIESPLIIGSNGLHEPSGFLTPTRLLQPPAT